MPVMLRLAYFSPLPPARTGVADYSRELLPYLAQRAEVTLFVAGAVDEALRQQFPAYSLAEYAFRRWHFDAALFHMGNSRHHAPFYHTFRRFPGILALHDYVLHHFLADQTAGQGNFPAYARELGYELGAAGIDLALDIQYQRQPHPLFTLPLNQRLLDLSLGVIGHSHYVAQRVGATTGRPVGVVPALIEPHPVHSRRAQLNLPPETLLIGSFGQITAARQIDVALHAFAQLRQTMPHAHYLVVGEAHAEVDLPALIAELQLNDSVTHLGFVADLAEFVDWIGSVDVVINLRCPTAGETSATALRALAAGCPLIVSNAGWYAELPDEVALKAPTPTHPNALFFLLQTLTQQPAQRQAMGQAARAYAQTHHSGPAVAAAYVAFIEGVLRQLGAASHA